jgi:hypothetical protein
VAFFDSKKFLLTKTRTENTEPSPMVDRSHYPNFSGMNKKSQNAKKSANKAATGKKKRGGYAR